MPFGFGGCTVLKVYWASYRSEGLAPGKFLIGSMRRRLEPVPMVFPLGKPIVRPRSQAVCLVLLCKVSKTTLPEEQRSRQGVGQ